MKRILSLVLSVVLVLGLALSLASCGKTEKLVSVAEIHYEPLGMYSNTEQNLDKLNAGGVTIGIPADASNGARALQLLAANGYLTFKANASDTPSVLDIDENPKNITFREIEAALLPNTLDDYDYAIINGNYVLQGKDLINYGPVLTESTDVAFPNILVVRESDKDSDLAKALAAALKSAAVKDYITENYKGTVISLVENPTDGFDASVNYEALKGTTVKVAATPAPHADVLEIAKTVLAQKDITLEIAEFEDYVQPNEVVYSGQVFANYFQHQPYLDTFNAEKGFN